MRTSGAYSDASGVGFDDEWWCAMGGSGAERGEGSGGAFDRYHQESHAVLSTLIFNAGKSPDVDGAGDVCVAVSSVVLVGLCIGYYS